MREKFCPRCGETKPVSEFYKESKRADGLSAWCKICKRASNRVVAKDWYDRNAETHIANVLANKGAEKKSGKPRQPYDTARNPLTTVTYTFRLKSEAADWIEEQGGAVWLAAQIARMFQSAPGSKPGGK